MERNILILIIVLGCNLGIFMAGLTFGRNSTFEDIISEKCWLNKQSRDVECINYISK